MSAGRWWVALGVALSAAARAEVLPDADCAGVYWDLTAAFDAGDRIYARVLVTRAGPGAHTAAGLGHWMAPDGTRTPFQNGRGDGRFELSSSGRRVRIGSTRLELGERAHRFEVDNDKRGVKLRVDLDAPAAPTPIFAGDLEVELAALAGRATASVWRRGMDRARELRGSATLVRTRHAACEDALAAWRVDVHRLGSDGGSLLVHQRLADGAQRQWLGWRGADGALRSLRPDEVAAEDWADGADGIALPRRLRPKGHELRGAIELGAVQLSIDPLDALPRLVRMLYWFGASPRRIWTDATSEVASTGPGSPPRGAAIASFTFLRPPADPTRSSSRNPGG